VLEYPDPAFGRWAWFVPVEFGLLGVAVGLLCPALERLFAGGAALRPGLATRAFELSLFAFLYFLTTLPGDGLGSAVLGVALLALAAARLLFDGARGDWAYVVAAAVLGPGTEAALSALSAFDYLAPDFAGITYWLPGLWANGGFMIRRLIIPIAVPGRTATDSPLPLRTAWDRS